jgi:SMP-30/Gluconolactonase/LRE-like region
MHTLPGPLSWLLAASSMLLPAAIPPGSATGTDVPHLHSYQAALRTPTRLAMDDAGNVLVSDPSAGTVTTRSPEGRIVSRSPALGHPVSVAVDREGLILVGDSLLGTVSAYSPDWEVSYRLGIGLGEFQLPGDVAVHPISGEIYVTDSKADQVRCYRTDGSLHHVFGASGSAPGEFSFPTGIAIDPVADRVYVADALNDRIQVLALDGTPVAQWPQLSAELASLCMPQGLWLDDHGTLYLAESRAGRVRIFDRSGATVGVAGHASGGPGSLDTPSDVLIDHHGRLFVSSPGGSSVELYGLPGYADPEAVAPAQIQLGTPPRDRLADQRLTLVIEVPGYHPDGIVVETIEANGIPALPASAELGNVDADDTRDLSIAFPRQALLDTLGRAEASQVLVDGEMAMLRFEGRVQLIRDPQTQQIVQGRDPVAADPATSPLSVVTAAADGTPPTDAADAGGCHCGVGTPYALVPLLALWGWRRRHA